MSLEKSIEERIKEICAETYRRNMDAREDKTYFEANKKNLFYRVIITSSFNEIWRVEVTELGLRPALIKAQKEWESKYGGFGKDAVGPVWDFYVYAVLPHNLISIPLADWRKLSDINRSFLDSYGERIEARKERDKAGMVAS